MEFFIDLLDANEGIDYLAVVYCFVGYLVIFWLIVSAFVGKDSYKKYGQNLTVSALWFLFVLLMGLPALILYLLVRPEEQNEGLKSFGAGLNVPLVNFVDKDNEIVMGIQLKINSQELTEEVKDMKISLDWDTADPRKKFTTEGVAKEAEVVEKKLNVLTKIMQSIKGSLEGMNHKKPAADPIPMHLKPSRSESKKMETSKKSIENSKESLEDTEISEESKEFESRDQKNHALPGHSRKGSDPKDGSDNS